MEPRAKVIPRSLRNNSGNWKKINKAGKKKRSVIPCKDRPKKIAAPVTNGNAIAGNKNVLLVTNAFGSVAATAT